MDMARTTTNLAPYLPVQGRRIKRPPVILAACALGTSIILLGNGSASAQTLTTVSNPTSAQPAIPIQSGALLLGPGDLIDIQVFGTPELSSHVRIDQQGSVRLPVGLTIILAGLTPAQASGVLEQQLKSTQIMQDPHVTTFVVEYATQGVTVLGEVRSPGTYNLLGPHSLYDALSAAGGPTPTQGASIAVTHVSDPDHPFTIPINSPNYSQILKNTAIYPGDTIVVAKASTISVVGDVMHSGTFYLQNGEPLTVLNAIALAAGLNRTAKSSRASIIRPTPTGAETIPIDLDKVIKNTAPNVVLQASDVLVIPRSGVKVFLETALPAASSAVTSATASALIVR